MKLHDFLVILMIALFALAQDSDEAPGTVEINAREYQEQPAIPSIRSQLPVVKQDILEQKLPQNKDIYKEKPPVPNQNQQRSTSEIFKTANLYNSLFTTSAIVCKDQEPQCIQDLSRISEADLLEKAVAVKIQTCLDELQKCKYVPRVVPDSKLMIQASEMSGGSVSDPYGMLSPPSDFSIDCGGALSDVTNVNHQLFENAASTPSGCTNIFTNDYQSILGTYKSHHSPGEKNQISSNSNALHICGLQDPPLSGAAVSPANGQSDVLSYQPSPGEALSDMHPCGTSLKRAPLALVGKCEVSIGSVSPPYLTLCNREQKLKIGYIISDLAFATRLVKERHWFSLYNAYLHYFGEYSLERRPISNPGRTVGTIDPRQCSNVPIVENIHGDHFSLAVKCGEVYRKLDQRLLLPERCAATYKYRVQEHICSHWVVTRLLLGLLILSGLTMVTRSAGYFQFLQTILMPFSALILFPLYYLRLFICPFCGSVRIFPWFHRCENYCAFCAKDITNDKSHACFNKSGSLLLNAKAQIWQKDPRMRVSYIVNGSNFRLAGVMLKFALMFAILYALPVALALHTECTDTALILHSKGSGSVTIPSDPLEPYQRRMCEAGPDKMIVTLAFKRCYSQAEIDQIPGSTVNDKMYALFARVSSVLTQGDIYRFAFKNANLTSSGYQTLVCEKFRVLVEDGKAKLMSIYAHEGSSAFIDTRAVDSGGELPQGDQATGDKLKPIPKLTHKDPLQTRTVQALLSQFNEKGGNPEGLSSTPFNVISRTIDGRMNIDQSILLLEKNAITFQPVSNDGPIPLVIKMWVESSTHVAVLKPEYETCSDGGKRILSGHVCVGSCDSCFETLGSFWDHDTHQKLLSQTIKRTWENVNNWACEGSGCWTINTGCLCAKCMNDKGSECHTVSSIQKLSPRVRICIDINGKSGCRTITAPQTISRTGMFSMEVDLRADDSILHSEQLVAMDQSSGLYYQGSIAPSRSDTMSFGQPQYAVDSKELMHHVADDDTFEKECHNQKEFTVSVKSCYAMTYHLKDTLQQIPALPDVNLLSVSGASGKVRINLILDASEYKWADETLAPKIESLSFLQCKDCSTLGTLTLMVSSKQAGSVFMECDGVRLLQNLVQLKSGASTVIVHADLTAKNGEKIVCKMIGLHGTELTNYIKTVDQSMIVRGRNITTLTEKSLAYASTISKPVSRWWPSWANLSGLTGIFQGVGFYIKIVLFALLLIAGFVAFLQIRRVASLWSHVTLNKKIA